MNRSSSQNQIRRRDVYRRLRRTQKAWNGTNKPLPDTAQRKYLNGGCFRFLGVGHSYAGDVRAYWTRCDWAGFRESGTKECDATRDTWKLHKFHMRNFVPVLGRSRASTSLDGA